MNEMLIPPLCVKNMLSDVKIAQMYAKHHSVEVGNITV